MVGPLADLLAPAATHASEGKNRSLGEDSQLPVDWKPGDEEAPDDDASAECSGLGCVTGWEVSGLAAESLQQEEAINVPARNSLAATKVVDTRVFRRMPGTCESD